MYSPQGFVKQLSNGKWGYELTLGDIEMMKSKFGRDYDHGFNLQPDK